MTKLQYMAVIAGPIALLAILISILSTGILETSDDRIENIKIMNAEYLRAKAFEREKKAGGGGDG